MLNRQADYSRTYSALDPNQRSAGPMSAPMAGRWTVLDAPRLSTLLAWMNHASSRRRFMRRTTIARRVTTRLWTASPWLACRSLLLGTIGTRRNVAPPWALLAHSRSVLATASACLRHAPPPSGSCSYGAFRLSSPSNPQQSWLFAKPLRLGFLSAPSRYHAPACSSFIQHMAS